MEAIYDAKARKIIELLKFKTRDEAVEELGYKTYKSLEREVVEGALIEYLQK